MSICIKENNKYVLYSIFIKTSVFLIEGFIIERTSETSPHVFCKKAIIMHPVKQ